MVLVLIFWINQIQPDRHALHHLDVVARRVLGREQAQHRTRGPANLGHLDVILPPAVGVDRNLPRSARPSSGRSWVSLKFAVIQMSSSETSVIRFWPTLTFWLISTLLRVMIPASGATILCRKGSAWPAPSCDLACSTCAAAWSALAFCAATCWGADLRPFWYCACGLLHPLLRDHSLGPAPPPRWPWHLSSGRLVGVGRRTAWSHCCFVITSFPPAACNAPDPALPWCSWLRPEAICASAPASCCLLAAPGFRSLDVRGGRPQRSCRY